MGDQGQTAGVSTVVSTTLTLGGTTSSGLGHSPRALNYTVDLTGIPADARMVRIQAKYQIFITPQAAVGFTVSDNGGSFSDDYLGPVNVFVEWLPAGVADANAAQRSSAYAVSASFAFDGGGNGSFSMLSFTVWYLSATS